MHEHGSLTSVTNNTVIEKTVQTSAGSSAAGGQITVTKTCDWGSRDTYTPALNSAYTGGSSYLLTTARQEQLTADLCRITLVYTSTAESTPATAYTEQSSTMEAPIQQHPDFADWSDEWDSETEKFKADSSKYGQVSYLVASSTATVTTYHSSMPSSDRGDIGTRQAPGGSIGGSSANWLLIGSNRGKQGNWYFKQNVYLYSGKPWDTDIYS